MNLDETGKLLAYVRVLDHRAAAAAPATDDGEELVITAWHDLLGALPAEDCLAAVRDYYRTGKFVITPADVFERVRAVQLARLKAAKEIDYPAALDGDPVREREYRLTWQGFVKRGVSPEDAYRRANELHKVPVAGELTGMPSDVRAKLDALIKSHSVPALPAAR
jgi:hypothetical protein